MQESTADSVRLRDLSHGETSLATTPSTPPPPYQRPRRLARLLYAGLALPRILIRHPMRSLIVVALLLLVGGGAGIAGIWLRAFFHLRAGRTALERYHTAESLPHLQIALSVWPNDPETLLLAARAARRSGVFEDAHRLLNHYQQLHYSDDKFVLERALVRAESGELDSVGEYCRTLLNQNRLISPLIYEALAQGYLRIYQPRKAEAILQEWFQHEPNNPQAFLIQGRMSELEMRQTGAIKSYRAALEADPAFNEARLLLCDALMRLGLLEEAQPHLEYLGQRLPNNLMVQVYLARIQDRQGNTRKAEQMLEEVLARQPEFAPALTERGKLAWRVGQTVEAEKWLRQAVARAPGNIQARYHLSLSLRANGKSDEAQNEQEQLDHLESDMENLQRIATGKMEQTPHNADLHYQVGMISLRAGAAAEGLRWLHNALKLAPKHQRTHQALMEYYQRIGDFDRAREHRKILTTTK